MVKRYETKNKRVSNIHIYKRVKIKSADPHNRPTHPNTHREDERHIHDILPRHVHGLVLRLQPAQERGRRRRQPPVVMPVVRIVATLVVAVAVVITPAIVTRRGSGAGQGGQAAVRGFVAVDLKDIGVVVVVPCIRELYCWVGGFKRIHEQEETHTLGLGGQFSHKIQRLGMHY